MITRTERTARRPSRDLRGAAVVLLAAGVFSPVVTAQSLNPLVFEEAPPTHLRTETDGDVWGSQACQNLARVIERELQSQPARGLTLLQHYRRECPGDPLPAGSR